MAAPSFQLPGWMGESFGQMDEDAAGGFISFLALSSVRPTEDLVAAKDTHHHLAWCSICGPETGALLF